MSAKGPSPLRVLVADHDTGAADRLAVLLTELGYAVRTARSASDALEVTDTFWPDVAFVEPLLSGQAGYRLAQHLCGQADKRRPLLVALTVLESAEHHQRAHEAGFDYFITKPGRLGRFLQSLAKMCPWRIPGPVAAAP